MRATTRLLTLTEKRGVLLKMLRSQASLTITENTTRWQTSLQKLRLMDTKEWLQAHASTDCLLLEYCMNTSTTVSTIGSRHHSPSKSDRMPAARGPHAVKPRQIIQPQPDGVPFVRSQCRMLKAVTPGNSVHLDRILRVANRSSIYLNLTPTIKPGGLWMPMRSKRLRAMRSTKTLIPDNMTTTSKKMVHPSKASVFALSVILRRVPYASIVAP